ncbi:unnamed protein product [Somion occarium]|uniref:Uncharacterized protein n=1 Tax=Somion occarium TaxID=3059160 RepID=A0ABP1CMF5_9APHY
MFVFVTAFLLSAVTLAVSQCVDPRPHHLCCRSLSPYRDNQIVWEGVCGFPGIDNTSVLVGGACSDIPCVFDGLYDVCCWDFLPCPASPDGTTGLNCTGHRVISNL